MPYLLNAPGANPGVGRGTQSGSDGRATAAAADGEGVRGILGAVALLHVGERHARGPALAQDGAGGGAALLLHREVVRGHQVADAAGRRQRPEGAAVRVQAGRLAFLYEGIGNVRLLL